ncbi:hypothetical protein F3J45_01440 [Pantoea sp. Ap-967]|uniref:hypothetical protein n=1 Tax=Pantoea sp. Ap-967 TaxID=2608362 RepID=UPI001422D154|nr:hypothetical protein [Pantoea sp. Ap-967]NIE73128.1 hypothetical protein [Pantoea sp. Ap-967]
MAHLALYKLELLDEFECRDDDWTCSDFERRLLQVRPKVFSQDAAGIIGMAHKDGSWPRTVKRFVLTRHQAGQPTRELLPQVVARLSAQERREWGLGEPAAQNPPDSGHSTAKRI